MGISKALMFSGYAYVILDCDNAILSLLLIDLVML
jgi:hypothetical protein